MWLHGSVRFGFRSDTFKRGGDLHCLRVLGFVLFCLQLKARDPKLRVYNGVYHWHGQG